MSYCMYNHTPAPGEECCDIYIYGDIMFNSIVCFNCCLNGDETLVFKKRSDVIQHIDKHRAAGHHAPYYYLIGRLTKEIDELGDQVVLDGLNGINGETR